MFRGWDEMDNEKTKKLHVHKRNPKDSGEWHLTILQSFINPTIIYRLQYTSQSMHNLFLCDHNLLSVMLYRNLTLFDLENRYNTRYCDNNHRTKWPKYLYTIIPRRATTKFC